ncbi:MAG TPA: hypothetical protein VGA37_03290 [Gemmatimonadales bacterium]
MTDDLNPATNDPNDWGGRTGGVGTPGTAIVRASGRMGAPETGIGGAAGRIGAPETGGGGGAAGRVGAHGRAPLPHGGAPRRQSPGPPGWVSDRTMAPGTGIGGAAGRIGAPGTVIGGASDRRPQGWMMTIPWTWSGITTNSSNVISGRIPADRNHSSDTIWPYRFNRIRPETTSPNSRSRLRVQIVMKYAPGAV